MQNLRQQAKDKVATTPQKAHGRELITATPHSEELGVFQIPGIPWFYRTGLQFRLGADSQEHFWQKNLGGTL